MKLSELNALVEEIRQKHGYPQDFDLDIVAAQMTGFSEHSMEYADIETLILEPAHTVECITEEKKEDRILLILNSFDNCG